jgi:AmiR/NasT family two-component response regulator
LVECAVAGNMDIPFDQAFSLLRDSARNRRIPLDRLATQIIETRSSPAEPDDT